MAAAAEVANPAKVPVRNAWYLLLYAWDLVHWKGRWQAQAEAAPNLLGLLARVLVDSTRDLLRGQLGRSFGETRDEISGVRGRIDFSASLKRLSFEGGRAVCAFPVLSIDTLRNRVLRATLECLVGDPRLVVGAKREVVTELQHELRAAVRAMEGVTPIRLEAGHFNRIQLGPSDRAYTLPLNVCRLIYDLAMPTEQAGDRGLAALSRDEIGFPNLFERFVRTFCRCHMAGCSVKAESLKWPGDSHSALVPAMVTDITVERPGPPARRLVIDTKYYKAALVAKQGGAEKLVSAHLYQIYTYLRTQEEHGARFRTASGMLLYPTTGVSLDEQLLVQGHRIQVATIDLAGDWQGIEERLSSLVESSLDAA